MVCIYCGFPLPNDAKHCPECGRAVMPSAMDVKSDGDFLNPSGLTGELGWQEFDGETVGNGNDIHIEKTKQPAREINPITNLADLDATRIVPKKASSFVSSDSRKSAESITHSQLAKDTESKKSSAEYAPARPKKPKKRRAKLIVTLIILGILVAAAGVLYFMGGFSALSLYRQLKTNDFKAAKATYSSRMGGDGIFLEMALESRLDSLYDEYRDGQKSQDNSLAELDTVKGMKLSTLKPKIAKTEKKLLELIASREAFEAGERLDEKDMFLEAIKQYEKVIKADSNYDEAKEKIENARKNYRAQVLELSNDEVRQGNYNGAIKVLETALDYFKEDDLISGRIEVYNIAWEENTINDIVKEADAAEQKGNYAEAIQIVLDAEAPESRLLNDKLAYYRSLYEDSFEIKLQTAISEEDYDEATRLISEARELIPESRVLSDAREELVGIIPDPLDLLTPTESSDNWSFSDRATDCFGEEHSDDINCIILNDGAFAEYALKGRYEKLKFSAVAGKNAPQSECVLKVVVQPADSPKPWQRVIKIKPDMAAKPQELFVEGCDTVRFEVWGEGAEIIMYSAELEYEN